MNVSQARIDKGLYWQRAWSLISGCSPVSLGCDHCWSATQAHIRGAQTNEKIRARYSGLTDDAGRWTGEIRLMEQDLGKPGSVRKPTTWAIWNDLFHPGVPFEFVRQAFAVMWFHEQHQFLILTKRPKRMAEFFIYWQQEMQKNYGCWPLTQWPLPNVFLGTTVEHPDYLHRIDELFESPAALYYVSVEPMLGAVDLENYLPRDVCATCGWEGHVEPDKCPDCGAECCLGRITGPNIGWAICGAETGPGKRLMELNDALFKRSMYRQRDAFLFQTRQPGQPRVGRATVGGNAEMKKGLLWYDDNPARAFEKKVALAAARHQLKHGQPPDLCYVPPGTPGVPCRVGPVSVEARGFVLAGHFQVGMKQCPQS